MSDETEKRNNPRAFISSDVECFQIEQKKEEGSEEKAKTKVENGEQVIRNCNEETITVKLLPTVCGKDVESILMTAKSDKSSEIDVNVTIISIGSSDIETKRDDVPLNLTMGIKKEVDTSACSTSKIYSDMPTYSQVQNARLAK